MAWGCCAQATASPVWPSAGRTPGHRAGQKQGLARQKGKEVGLGWMSSDGGVPYSQHPPRPRLLLYSRPCPSEKLARGSLSCWGPSPWLDVTRHSRPRLGSHISSQIWTAATQAHGRDQLDGLPAPARKCSKQLQAYPGDL